MMSLLATTKRTSLEVVDRQTSDVVCASNREVLSQCQGRRYPFRANVKYLNLNTSAPRERQVEANRVGNVL